MWWIFFACIDDSNFGTGNTDDQGGSYQWGNAPGTDDDSGSEQDSGEESEPEAETGYAVGDRAPELLATDHLGSPWSLHGQGANLLLMIGHLDSNALPMMLTDAAQIEGDFISAALIGHNIYSSPASAADAALVAEEYGLGLALSDSSQELVNEWTDRNPPKAYLLSPQHIILWAGYQSLDGGAITQSLE